MDYSNILTAISSLVFCLLLLIIFWRIWRSNVYKKHHETGFNIENIAHVDSKRKLMKLDFEGKRYLILLGAGETLLDKTIDSANKRP
ncbi:hypothetical protein Cyrtocomes_00260 [Candidatus Cyrtobacter comes]|uniref:Flagellar biosynthesis protein, FliO n=1 Tax=Candidatus Cyrtobacter comes TaxID=675776 RepID=A0ABU5L7M5_9RICK|nr:hypothetical protein [Candidatus Cyrtobacter comes]MDZ5761900.1 hypothetical protein [Candidatus Cyrtobacter comes]